MDHKLMAPFDSASMPAALPKRLRKDAIVEALLEIRFKGTDVPEVTIGRLVADITSSMQVGAKVERLPLADLPAQIRRADPNLAYQPILQLWSENRTRVAKIGEQVLSWHALQPYPGWNAFKSELGRVIEGLAKAVANPDVTRLGFRYINALRGSDHGINALQDLNLAVAVGGATLVVPLNINYRQMIGDHHVLTRVATPEFVEAGPVPIGGFAVMIDIDVSTEGAKGLPTVDNALTWTETAHDAIKAEFFRLLKPETLENLREE